MVHGILRVYRDFLPRLEPGTPEADILSRQILRFEAEIGRTVRAAWHPRAPLEQSRVRESPYRAARQAAQANRRCVGAVCAVAVSLDRQCETAFLPDSLGQLRHRRNF